MMSASAAVNRKPNPGEHMEIPEVNTEAIEAVDWAYGSNRMWAVSDDSFFPCEKTEKTLPSGQYVINCSDSKGIYFTRKITNMDNLLVLPDSKAQKVLQSIEHFWNCEKKFKKHGFLWKRGIMLFGPPGGGKTVLCQQLSQQIVDKGGISIYLNDAKFTAEGLRVLRLIEAERPIVVMIEDIDAIVQRGNESAMLALLDGELQINNVVFVATTNYPERLDARLKNRPSRFDEIVEIDLPSAAARSMYICHKNVRLKKDPVELEIWVKGTKDLSIAHIREIIIAVECLGNNLEETIDRIQAMNVNHPTSEDDSSKKEFGFLTKNKRD